MMDQFEMCLALRKRLCSRVDELRAVITSMSDSDDEVSVRMLAYGLQCEIESLAQYGTMTGMIPEGEKDAYLSAAEAISKEIARLLGQKFMAKKVRKGSDLGQDFPELSNYMGKLIGKLSEFRQEFDELLIAYEQSFKFISVLKASGVSPEFYDLPLELGRRAEHMLRVAHCDGLINREERNELFGQIEEIKLANRSIVC